MTKGESSTRETADADLAYASELSTTAGAFRSTIPNRFSTISTSSYINDSLLTLNQVTHLASKLSPLHLHHLLVVGAQLVAEAIFLRPHKHLDVVGKYGTQDKFYAQKVLD
ncbi:hypothetical protein TorRG33x02_222880 [Trema orientale]|uniref:Uncharacterized protein n=1 Tax=Trema orientale TaxID=63057 RepID=A0A2P5E8U4_TREOI|nr:hypothetical protein TorRG33x02_222880 [Trema orientale]